MRWAAQKERIDKSSVMEGGVRADTGVRLGVCIVTIMGGLVTRRRLGGWRKV